MKKNIKLLFLPVIAMSLASCSSLMNIKDVVDIKSAIQYLGEHNNFKVTRETNGVEDFEATYNPYYSYDETNNFGYVNKGGWVYPFTIQDGKVVNKHYTDSYLYGKDGIAPTFAKVNLDNIKSGVKSFKTSKKDVAMPLLNICGYDNATYTVLDWVEVSMEGVDLNTITLTFSISEFVQGQGLKAHESVASITKVDKARYHKVDDFIRNGVVSDVDKTLKEIKNLFAGNNFTSYLTDEKDVLVRVEKFHPSYYVRLFTDAAIEEEPLLRATQVAHLEIFEPDKRLPLLTDGEKVYPLIYDDVYHFLYLGSYDTPTNELAIVTKPNSKRPGYAQGAFTEVQHSIEKAWKYPSSMYLFENLDEMKNGEEANTYYTTSEKVINDFLFNFGMYEQFESLGGGVELDLIYDQANTKVTFRCINASGSYYEITFGDFGTTKFEQFDDLLKTISEFPGM